MTVTQHTVKKFLVLELVIKGHMMNEVAITEVLSELDGRLPS